jgi:hypothetical protein
MSRRRARANELTIISWRDIPAQVTASVDGRTEKALLEPRFQVAIDRAATVAGLTETSAYVAQWQRRTHPLEPGTDPAGAAAQAAADLQHDYDRARLEALVAAGGLTPDVDSGSDNVAAN